MLSGIMYFEHKQIKIVLIRTSAIICHIFPKLIANIVGNTVAASSLEEAEQHESDYA